MRFNCVSSAISAQKREKFKRHFKDLFDAKYDFTGFYSMNGSRIKILRYHIIRFSSNNECHIDGREM